MAITPQVYRRATPQELELAVNSYLTPLLATRVNGVEVDQAKNNPYFSANLYIAITTEPSTVVMASPFVFKTFVGQSEDDVLSLANQFIAANPTAFFSPVYAVYRPSDPNPVDAVVLGIFYNLDAANAALNWAAGGGAALTTIPTGKTVWVDATFGNDATGLVQRQDKPFATISAAVAAASSGMLVWVRPGTYTEAGSIDKDGIMMWCDAGATINYTGSLFGSITNGQSFSLFGNADLVATGAASRLINNSASSSTLFLQFDMHLSTVANNAIGCRVDSPGVSVTIVCNSIIGNNSTTFFGFGNSFSTSATSSMRITVNGNVTQNGAGSCMQSRANVGQISLSARNIIATIGNALEGGGGGAAGNCSVTCDSIQGVTGGIILSSLGCYDVIAKRIVASNGPGIHVGTVSPVRVSSAFLIQGTTFGIFVNAGGTVSLEAVGQVTGTAGPGISITSGTGTVNLDSVGTITGTSAGINLTAGTIVGGARTVTASAGPGLNTTGVPIITLLIDGTIQGTTAGAAIGQTGGTLQLTAGTINGTGGPGLTVSTTTNAHIITALNIISGTTFGVQITGGGGTLSIQTPRINASAGIGVSTAVGNINLDNVGLISGTTGGIDISGGIVTGNIRSITATSGPGFNSVGAATVVMNVAGTLQGTTAGAALGQSGSLTLTAGLINGTAGPGVVATLTPNNCAVTAQAAITGTTFGLSVTGGTGSISVQTPRIQASTGIGVNVSASTLNLNCVGSVIGVTGGISVSGGTITGGARTITTTGGAGVATSGTPSVTIDTDGTIQGVSAGVSINHTGTCQITSGLINATGGPGLEVLNNSAQFSVAASIAITGTTFGINMTGGAGNVVVQTPRIQASAGPGVNVSASTLNLDSVGGIFGTTSGLTVSGGTVNGGSRTLSGSAGPGMTTSGAPTISIDVDGAITGTTSGLSVGQTGTLQLGAGTIVGSAGPGIILSATATNTAITARAAITGTTTAISVTGGVGSTIIDCPRIQASAGPGIIETGGTLTLIINNARIIGAGGANAAIARDVNTGVLALQSCVLLPGGTNGISAAVATSVYFNTPCTSRLALAGTVTALVQAPLISAVVQ